MQGTLARRECAQLVVRERFEERGEPGSFPRRSSMSTKISSAGRCGFHHDHAMLRTPAVPANDEAAILQFADHARGARDGYVEQLGQPAHRDRAGVLEDHEHVEMDEAQGAPMPMAQCACPLALPVPRRQLTDDVGDQGAAGPIRRRDAGRPGTIQ